MCILGTNRNMKSQSKYVVEGKSELTMANAILNAFVKLFMTELSSHVVDPFFSDCSLGYGMI